MTQFGNLTSNFDGGGLVEIHHHHRRPLLRESSRHRFADAHARAGDNGHLAHETSIPVYSHCLFSLVGHGALERGISLTPRITTPRIARLRPLGFPPLRCYLQTELLQ